jgi:Signal transduction histidine kinase
MQTKNTSTAIEPGVLPLFQIFVGVQLLLMLWNWFVSRLTPRARLLIRFPRLTSWFIEKRGSSEVYLLLAIILLAFFLFLLIPQIHRWMGKTFLPIALVVQVIIIILGNDLLVMARQNANLAFDTGSRDWQLFIFLFIPIILASWQYRFSRVILLVLFTSLLELSFYLFVPGAPSFQFGTGSSFLIGRSLLYTFVGYVITSLMNDQRALRASLQSANQQLRNYMVTQEALATARERNRLSRELHDTLAHTLSGLIINLEAFGFLWKKDPVQAQAELEKMTGQARTGLNEARRAIKSLRATPLEEMGLLLALQQAVKDAALRGGFQIKTSFPESLPILPLEIENDIYRVVVEAFENIVQHAHAKTAELSISLSADLLLIKIADDGIGFDPSRIDARTHFGLLGLQERARAHGANLKISSQPGQGTLILFQMKVPQ